MTAESSSPSLLARALAPWRGAGAGAAWWRGGGLLLAGAVASLGFAPWHAWWLTVAALALLFMLCAQARPGRAAVYGFLFGVGHFTSGFSWLLTSLHDNGGLALPLSWGMLLALAACMALYPALVGGVLGGLAGRPLRLLAMAPGAWVVSEWLRGWLFTGFPWNLAGYVWDGWLAMLQLADLAGVWGLSWLTAWLAALLAVAGLTRGRTRWRVLALLPATLLAGHLHGLWRLADLAAPPPGAAPLKVALVQPNIPQKLKWDKAFFRQGATILGDLTLGLERQAEVVVWPESAVTRFLQLDPELAAGLGRLSAAAGAVILTGVPLAESGDEGWQYYNGMVAIGPGGGLERVYHKHHLVPFGEFIPLRGWVPDTFSKFTHGTKDYSRGPGPRTLAWGGGTTGPLVCYEAIFPEEVRALARQDPGWLVNVTNDAWFGPAAQPQHLAMARLRAVENRLPLVRVANTGISAAFDRAGRPLAILPAGERGAVVTAIHPGPGGGLYRLAGPWWVVVCLLLTVGLRAWHEWESLRRRRVAETPA